MFAAITQGLNTRGGQITQELNTGSLDELSIEILVQLAKGDWYVRRKKDSPLIGPFSFFEADNHARFMSMREGLAEVVTILGTRAGDPITDPTRIFVDGMYANGKKFLGGRVAQFHSDGKLLEDL